MRAIVLRDVGSYSYAGTGYENPLTSVGGTTYTYDNNGNHRARWWRVSRVHFEKERR